MAASQWWSNWPMTFGYVGRQIYPTSLDELSNVVLALSEGNQIKAVGGGWSFSDAALPFSTQAQVDAASIVGAATSTVSNTALVADPLNTDPIFQGFGGPTVPMDVMPLAVGVAVERANHYSQADTLWEVTPGVGQGAPPTAELNATLSKLLTPSGRVAVINTSQLGSSLQQGLPGILSQAAAAKMSQGTRYFHVEAGIAMRDLVQLLDHQSPRLALRSSGGSPGATLAGTLATSTHGGEFRWPLLVDTVKAIHLVGPDGVQWWIEGTESIADPQLLATRYPKLDVTKHFIAGNWQHDTYLGTQLLTRMTAQDFLNAVIVSLGALGVVYSVVFEATEQYGLRQRVVRSTWDQVVAAGQNYFASTRVAADAPDIQTALQAGSAAANNAVLNVLIDGQTNGTGISAAENVYIDLAINPINFDTWVTNREVTAIPLQANNKTASVFDYVNAVQTELDEGNPSIFGKDVGAALGNVFDLFGWARDVFDAVNDLEAANRLAEWILQWPDGLSSSLAALATQSVSANGLVNRGTLGRMLSGLLDGIQRTQLGAPSDATDVSYRVGAIGWPDGGIPGTALEIALAPNLAFSFLQNVLIDEFFRGPLALPNPLLGYISVRVCQTTHTTMGMQQYAPYSVMIELVGYRSPEAKFLMSLIQARVLALNTAKPSLNAMLHWGLENQMLTANGLANTPLSARPHLLAPSRLEWFRTVRQLLSAGTRWPNAFDNNFTRRLAL